MNFYWVCLLTFGSRCWVHLLNTILSVYIILFEDLLALYQYGPFHLYLGKQKLLENIRIAFSSYALNTWRLYKSTKSPRHLWACCIPLKYGLALRNLEPYEWIYIERHQTSRINRHWRMTHLKHLENRKNKRFDAGVRLVHKFLFA